MNLIHSCLLSALLVPALTSPAQSKAAEQPPVMTERFTIHTEENPKYAVEAVMALRSVLPKSASALVDESTSTITVTATAPQIQLARKVMADLEAAPASAAHFSQSDPLPTPEIENVLPRESSITQTFYLGQRTWEDSAKTATLLRNKTSTRNKIFLVPDIGAIIVRVRTPDELNLIQSTIAEPLPNWSPSGNTSEPYSQQTPNVRVQPSVEEAFYLRSGESSTYYGEVFTALRNMLSPLPKFVLVTSKRTVIVIGTEPELELAHKVMADLDKPGIKPKSSSK